MLDISERNKKIAINRWQNVFNKHAKIILDNSKRFPHLKARIVGYLMGDGSVTVRKENNRHAHHTLCFYPDDDEMLRSFLFAFQKIYAFLPTVKKLPHHYAVRADSKAAILDLLTESSFRSLEWHIPTSVLSSETTQREWLRAFYDCEGYVGKKVIAVQSVNKNGLLQVQNLLNEFGIQSRLYQYNRKQKNWNINYLLYIMKKASRITFLSRIGFNHKRKRDKLKLYAGVA